MKRDEKCLICVIGQIRASELTWDGFKKYVLDPLNADLALCLDLDKDAPEGTAYHQKAKYIWGYNKPDNYADVYDHVKRELNSDEEWRILLDVPGIWLGHLRGPGGGAIEIFLRWLLSRKILENDLLNKYDRFIVTRSDFLYCAPHPLLERISPEYIWLPAGGDYGGYNDRHLVAGNKDILKCLDLMNDIILTPKKLHEEMMGAGEWNVERYLAHQWKKNGLGQKIKRFPPIAFLIRGEKDRFAWRSGHYNEEVGLVVKYKEEFNGCRGLFTITRNGTDCRRYFSFRKLIPRLKYLLLTKIYPGYMDW